MSVGTCGECGERYELDVEEGELDPELVEHYLCPNCCSEFGMEADGDDDPE